MTSTLEVKEIELFRSFKNTAIVLMLLLRLDRPLGESEIAGLLDMSPTTVRRYLRALACAGVVTRTHRYHGWTLTAGGRQMVLGESKPPLLAENVVLEQVPEEDSVEINTNVKNSRSSDKNCRSQLVAAAESGASAKNSLSSDKIPRSSDKDCRSQSIAEAESGASVKNCRSSVKNCRSRPLAAASLSLSFKEEKDAAAAATDPASVKNCRSNDKNPRSSDRIARSLSGRRIYWAKNGDKAVGEMQHSYSGHKENLEAFASIGVLKNKHVLEICKMKHVNPGFILGQKKRLEAERRYSPGLLLTVIRCNDYLPEKYLPCKGLEPGADISGSEPEPEEEPEEEPEPIQKIEPDPSIYEPVSENGITAMKAWSIALSLLKVDISRSNYNDWVKDSTLFSARDGIFVIAACSQYACDWMTSRLSSTLMRLLTGICNRSVEIRIVNLDRLGD